MDKIASNRIVKIGIVTEDVDATAARLESLFDTVPAYDPELSTAEEKAAYTAEDKFRFYKGEPVGDIPMKVKVVYVEPVYFELIEPLGDCRSPWHDHLKTYGTSVCFISFYVGGLRQHIDMMNRKGLPLLFEEEKGFERYAYFDTMKALGFTLEMKERVPNPPKAKQ